MKNGIYSRSKEIIVEGKPREIVVFKRHIHANKFLIGKISKDLFGDKLIRYNVIDEKSKKFISPLWYKEVRVYDNTNSKLFDDITKCEDTLIQADNIEFFIIFFDSEDSTKVWY